MTVSQRPVPTPRSAPPDLRVCAALAGICVAAYLPQLVALCFGAWPFGDDALAAMVPWRQVTLNAFRHGVLPLWNPRLFCGMAFMSNGQSAVLYPPNFVYYVLPAKLALLTDAVAHNVLFATGTYALARALRLSRAAAFLAAMSLGLSSVVSAHIFAGHTTWHAARAYLPWALWALLCYLRAGDRRFLLAITGALGLQAASGSPPLVLLTMALCAGLTMAWWSTRRGHGQAMPPGWMGAALATASVTGLLAAVQVLPLRELSRLTVHGTGLTFQDATAFSGTWRTFFKLLAPGFFGGTADLQWGTLGEAHEEAAYIGLLPAILAVGAPWLARRRMLKANGGSSCALPRPVWWLWALLPLSVVLTLGHHTPVYGWLFNHIGVLRMLRLPTRWLELWCLAGPLLAGFAFDGCRDAVANTANGSGRFLTNALWTVAALFLLLGMAMSLTAAGSSLWVQPAAELLRHVTTGDRLKVADVATRFRTLAIVESFTVCLLASLGASLWRRWRLASSPYQRRRVEVLILAFVALDGLFSFWRYPHIVTAQHDREFLSWPHDLTRLYRPEQRWSTRVLWVAINRGEPLGIDLVNGYDPMSTRRYFAFAQAVEGREFWDGVYQPEHYPPLLRVAGVTHTLSQAGMALGPDAAQLTAVATSGEWRLWRQPDPWPRAYLSRHILHLTESAQLSLLNALASQPFRSSEQPAVAGPTVLTDIPAIKLTATDRVLSWRGEQNRMTMQTVTAAPSVLVQSDAWYPGWRAWVNGQPTRLERVNYLFRGTRVPAGPARVQVVYEPATYRCALFLTLCGLAALTAPAISLVVHPLVAGKAAAR